MSTRDNGFTPTPEGPPLPFPLPFPEPPEPQPQPNPLLIPPPLSFRSLRCGCYLMNYTPAASPLVSYDGSLRVECHADGRTASGDLYQRPVIWLPLGLGRPPRPILLGGPSPAAGIPVLSRSRYRYYLRVTQLAERFVVGNSFTLGFEMWRFTKATGGWSTGGTWANEGAFTARVSWQTAPPGYPSASDYLAGDVKNAAGVVVGRLTLGWVSAYLRKATVEIDRVAVSEPPLDNGAGVGWKAVGDSVGWDITVDESDANVAEPSGESWSDAEAHAAMLARRDASNLDAEWRYHVLCVRRLDSTERGIMYDAYGGDSNNVPREGCVISSHWVMPNTAEWGTVKGVRFGKAPAPYFRTAVHEAGHAMGLYHNTADHGYMNTTNVIAGNSLDPGSPAFPANIRWAYHPDDAKRLRHMPDIYVRPGGTPFGTSYGTTPISPTDLCFEFDGLTLTVTPLLDAVPFGAPVRVNVELTNTSAAPLPAPASLGLKGGAVKGLVADPSGTVRVFSPVVICVEDTPLVTLAPGESVRDSLTLLRGPNGPLFPLAGVHKVTVEVHWDRDGAEAEVSGQADVMVTPAVDDAHARAAAAVLSTPDALLMLAIGGDHLVDGVAVVQAAVQNPVLAPHFAFIEAKRLARRFGKRKANLKAATDLIDEHTVMSPAEVKRAAEMVSDDGADSAAGKNLAKKLKGRVKGLKAGDDVKAAVDAL